MRSAVRLAKEYTAFRLRRALNLAGLEAEIHRLAAELAEVRRSFDQAGFIRQGQIAAPMPELTFICSRGRTGTMWLTEALNRHPEILAAHGPGAPPFWFHGKPGAKVRVSEDQQWHSRMGELSLAQCRAEMVLAGPARYYALVHALTVPEVAAKLGEKPATGQVATVNVVRHPVPRINSFQADWLLGDLPHSRRFRSYLIERWRHEEVFAQYRERILRRFVVDFTSLREVLFVMACYWLRYDHDDFGYPVRHFAFERLVSERSYLSEFLRAGFGPSFAPTAEYLDTIAGIGRRNARTMETVAPEAAFSAWEDWQKFCFSIVFEDIDLPRAYVGFGYDFSFITGSPRRAAAAARQPQPGASATGLERMMAGD